jgi:hypothetical protein
MKVEKAYDKNYWARISMFFDHTNVEELSTIIQDMFLMHQNGVNWASEGYTFKVPFVHTHLSNGYNFEDHFRFSL